MDSSKRMKLKICGMRDAENIRRVAVMRPDYMGFIFYSNSKRAVGEKFAIPDDFPDAVRRVGVFVNENSSVMLNLAREYSLDFLQLHGSETAAQCEDLRNKGLMIIKAFSVGRDFNFDSTVPYKQSAEYFLFDTKGPGYGGTGKAFDWMLLEKYDQEVPFFLSGGRARAEGYGEVLTPIVDPSPVHVVLIKPDVDCSTVEMYGRLDKAQYPFRDFPATEELYNDFERVAPCESMDWAERIEVHGAYCAGLTGSGSAVFGLFESESAAASAFKRLESERAPGLVQTRFASRAESLRILAL